MAGSGTLFLQSRNFRHLAERYTRFVVRAAACQGLGRGAGSGNDFGGLLQMAAGFWPSPT